MGSKRGRVERVGWVLFTLCALFYSAANTRARDWLSLAGSILFLLACIVFISVPRWDRDADRPQADRL